MKIFLNRILVVEGKEDASYLSNYIDSEIVVINGYELSKATISYLKDKPVILLLDPDKAGLDIREKLNSLLNDAININVDINKCTRGTKNGIAECQIDEILSQLKDFSAKKPAKLQYFQTSDLYKLGLSDNKELRKYVCKRLNLGECNFKSLTKRLEMNNISLPKLYEIIEEYQNGNK